MGFSLMTRVERLSRVGKTTARRLSYLGIYTVRDLLFHFPFRYEDFGTAVLISSLQPGNQVTVRGTIRMIGSRKAKDRRLNMTSALLEDDSGTVTILWFNQPYIAKQYAMGDSVIISGTVSLRNTMVQIVNPSIERLSATTHLNTGGILPVYSTTANVTQKQLRFLMSLALTCAAQALDWIPSGLRERYDLLSLADALTSIHFPKDHAEASRSAHRLKFDELLLIQLRNALSKQAVKKNKGRGFTFDAAIASHIVASLPFELTGDQKKAAFAILKDIEREESMNRLLEGDVGSGKTVVAALAMHMVAHHGAQSAIMAPTEILAKQHYLTLKKILPADATILLFTRTQRFQWLGGVEKELSKKEALLSIEEGMCSYIIGTHAIIQEGITFRELGLVIIDEQHRFGVEQRKALKERNRAGYTPHFLSMTATPIPRSLALVLYGDLDLSIIKELPKGRKAIETKVINEKQRAETYTFIRAQVQSGRQVFVICPLIDPSDVLGVKSVKEEYERLNKTIFPDLSIGLLHGKLKGKDKDDVLTAFKHKSIDVLVSTSVIEVGIDIPNATIMMIEGAERFGLAQLHQFRGRVGRGEHQSYCFLFPSEVSQRTRERLTALEKSSDGFALAEYDLKYRGPGEVYGKRQSGMPDLKIATLSDVSVLQETKEAAALILNDGLSAYPLLEKKMNELIEDVHFE